jgi:mevalonate kinase
MSTQPEALRLADELDTHAHHAMNGEAFYVAGKAAAELRRLIALNQQLLKALKDSDKLIEQLMPGVRYIALQDYAFLNDTLMANTAAIKAGEQA